MSTADDVTDDVTDDGEPGEVGTRIRRLRERKGLSAKQVAHGANISAAYLSRVENAKASPTVATLSQVLQAMGETMGTLFGSVADEGPVVRAGERLLLRSRGVRDYRLTPGWATRLEVLESIVEPGEGSGPRSHTHPGDEECLVVLEGEITLWLDEHEHRLGAGDSATYQCRAPHWWQNHTGTAARALWIFTPATY